MIKSEISNTLFCHLSEIDILFPKIILCCSKNSNCSSDNIPFSLALLIRASAWYNLLWVLAFGGKPCSFIKPEISNTLFCHLSEIDILFPKIILCCSKNSNCSSDNIPFSLALLIRTSAWYNLLWVLAFGGKSCSLIKSEISNTLFCHLSEIDILFSKIILCCSKKLSCFSCWGF